MRSISLFRAGKGFAFRIVVFQKSNDVSAAFGRAGNNRSNPFGNTISFDFQSDEATCERERPEEVPDPDCKPQGVNVAAKACRGGRRRVFKWGFALHSEL